MKTVHHVYLPEDYDWTDGLSIAVDEYLENHRKDRNTLVEFRDATEGNEPFSVVSYTAPDDVEFSTFEGSDHTSLWQQRVTPTPFAEYVAEYAQSHPHEEEEAEEPEDPDSLVPPQDG